MTNKQSALKPCPFCGSHKYVELLDSDTLGFYVQCGKCWASSRGENDKASYTIERWNKRASPSPWIEIKSDDDLPELFHPVDIDGNIVESGRMQSKPYLISAGKVSSVIGIGYLVKDSDIIYWYARHLGSFNNVTHYMPIPELNDDNV